MELELDRLTKQYGPKIAVDRVSARLGAGVYGLLGANGAGKTTIMRMICGILRPTSGEVRLDGRPTAEMGGEFRARLGYLPQDFGYYPEFTALDFMEYMAALKGLDSRGARTRSLELLDRVGLAGEERRLIRTFSGGMKQRLGIAQAVLNDPDVLVLDEPTAGLDPKERVRFRNLIASFAADKVVLLSTHIVSDVECIADSILMMRAGSLIMRVPRRRSCRASTAWSGRPASRLGRRMSCRPRRAWSTSTTWGTERPSSGSSPETAPPACPAPSGPSPRSRTCTCTCSTRAGRRSVPRRSPGPLTPIAAGAAAPISEVADMLSLIKFELKKMLTRRVAVAANAGAIVMLVAVMALNVMQARAEGNTGEILSGPEAIAHRREVAEARAGELTPERVAADIARYQEIAYERLNPEELAEMSDAAAYEAVAETYGEATRLELYDPYYITLLKPWAVRGLEPYQYAFRVTPEMALDFYGALAASLQDSLDEGMGGEWVYSPAERAFWTEKEAGVAEPIGYGWSGGWDNILDCTAFLVFAIFAACVTVTPLFASEYREGTDAVLLSSLNGRGRLVAAKLAAAALYATALFAAGAAIVCGVSLAFYGAGGADLAIQNYALASPYNLTMAQAAALYIGIFYLVMLGMLALTLALSASTPSTLAIIVTDVVVLFVTGLLPSAGVGVLRHILTLFPMGLQSPFDMFAALFSYPVGPVVLDLISMATLVYGALVAVGVPLALGRWCRHQVA